MMDVYDFIGLIGVVVSLACYAKVQWRRDYAKEIGYSLGNCIGSLCMATSLWHKWNLASFVSNTIWALLSAYGVYRCWKYAKNAPARQVSEALAARVSRPSEDSEVDRRVA